MSEVDGQPRPTIALLGASNLTRGFSTVVETLRLQHQLRPLRIVAALGHGRSYGQRSSVLGRSLPGILDCGLWDALAAGLALPADARNVQKGTQSDESASGRHSRPCGAPSFALITDIGNDVMYGVQPATIIGWVEQCIDRLIALSNDQERGDASDGSASGAGGARGSSGGRSGSGGLRINICGLPMDSIRRVKPWHFAIVKNIMFPTHDITYDLAMERSFEMQRLVEELADRRGPLVRLVQHERDWYGFDPIHVRMKHWPTTWARFLAHDDAHLDLRAKGSLARWRRVRMHMPAAYRIFGIDKTRAQPLTLEDGTTVEMY